MTGHPSMAGPSRANPSVEADHEAAREVVYTLDEIASLLNVDLSIEELSYCVSLIENGVNPDALATVIQELQAKFPRQEDDDMADDAE